MLFRSEGGKRTPQDGEPRRNERGPGGRDRDRRPPRRDNDRPGGSDRPAPVGSYNAGQSFSGQGIGEPAAPVQMPPTEARPARTGGPIMPPLMPPTQPAWKEPVKQTESAPETSGEPEGTKPEGTKPEGKE